MQEKNSYFLNSIRQWFFSLGHVFIWYYVVKILHASDIAPTVPHGWNYFAYVIVGFAFIRYTQCLLDDTILRLIQEQTQGTLEAMFLTKTHPISLLFLLGISPFLYGFIYIAIYVGVGFAISHTPISLGNWMATIVTLLLTVISLSGFSIISAACVIAFKRSYVGGGFHYYFLALFSGALFPVSLLPEWLQKISYFIPLTYSLNAVRMTLLEGAGFGLIWKDLAYLCAFTIIGVPLGLWVFQQAVRKARVDGSLAFF